MGGAILGRSLDAGTLDLKARLARTDALRG
jgi:hypothetical protein